MVVKVRKDYYEDKERERYSLIKVQKSDYKKVNHDLLKKIQSYIAISS